MKILNTSFLSLLLLIQSCSKGKSDECTGACTEEFRTSMVNIEDSEKHSVALDRGFINNLEVLSENYKVGADCCHVYHVSGNLNIEME